MLYASVELEQDYTELLRFLLELFQGRVFPKLITDRLRALPAVL